MMETAGEIRKLNKGQSFCMESFIPSKTYRAFLKEQKIELNSRQKALLIYGSGRPIEEKWAAYRGLLDTEEVEDKLRKSLETILAYEKAYAQEALAEKESCVYSLQTYVPEDGYEMEDNGVFASLCEAKRIGSSLGQRFIITRHEIRKHSEEELNRMEQQVAKDGYLCVTEQSYRYDEEGRLLNLDFWKNESDTGKREFEKYSDAEDYLSNIYGDFPNCFQNGDIIRSCIRPQLKDYYGIVHIFPNWEEEKKRLMSIPGMGLDDELLVEFLFDNGNFGHEHIMVTDMEKAEVDQIPEQYMGALRTASRLLRGYDTFEDLQIELEKLQGKG